jgi:hypothetical protein
VRQRIDELRGERRQPAVGRLGERAQRREGAGGRGEEEDVRALGALFALLL